MHMPQLLLCTIIEHNITEQHSMASQRKGSSMADENILHSGGHHHHRRHCFSALAVQVTVVAVMVGVVVFVGLNHSSNPTLLFQRSNLFSGPKDDSAPGYLSPPSSPEATGEEMNASSSQNGKYLSPPTSHETTGEKISASSSSANDTELRPLPTAANQSTGENLHDWAQDANNLGAALKRATMEDNKTVIITTLNSAWAKPNSIFDLFLESFRIGEKTEHLLNHLVVIAFDQKAYSRCLEVHQHCYPLTTEGIDYSSEVHYMTKDYLKMMWRRTDFLRTVLELGYNFVFTDADIMWLRDPFPRFYPNVDFQIACDFYRFNSTNLRNDPNGGFIHVKANNRTIQFYKFWNGGKDYFPGKNEQDVLNTIKFFPIMEEIGLELRFLDTAYFGGFCEPSKYLNLVVTMHANCCTGLENKIHDIKIMIDDWKKYKSLRARRRSWRNMTWSRPRFCQQH